MNKLNITKDQALKVCQLRTQGLTMHQIADKMPFSAWTVRRVLRGEAGPRIELDPTTRQKLTEVQKATCMSGPRRKRRSNGAAHAAIPNRIAGLADTLAHYTTACLAYVDARAQCENAGVSHDMLALLLAAAEENCGAADQ